MAEKEEELKNLAKERAREKAKQRLNSLNSGDLSRGLSTKDVSKTPSARPKKASPTQQEPKSPSKTKKAEPKTAEKPVEVKKGKQKASLGKIVVDKNTIEQMATATNDSKARRKQLVIISLSILIVLIWTFVIVTKMIKPKGPDNNCFMYLSGNASSNCELLLNGDNVSEWIAPDGISPQAKYNEIKIELNLKSEGIYNIRFKVEIYNNGNVVKNFGIVDTLPSYSQSTDANGFVWYVLQNVDGNQKIIVLTGIAFQDLKLAPELRGISSQNAVIKIYVEVNRA